MIPKPLPGLLNRIWDYRIHLASIPRRPGVRIGQNDNCAGLDCYRAKAAAYRAIWLEQASAATGLPAVDSGPLSYNDYTSWYKGGNEPIIKHARSINCPNLKVTWSDWGQNYLKPNDLKTNQPYDRDHCIYVCHHSGGRCQCQKDLHREEDEAKAKAEQELEAALDARRQRIDAALAGSSIKSWKPSATTTANPPPTTWPAWTSS